MSFAFGLQIRRREMSIGVASGQWLTNFGIKDFVYSSVSFNWRGQAAPDERGGVQNS